MHAESAEMEALLEARRLLVEERRREREEHERRFLAERTQMATQQAERCDNTGKEAVPPPTHLLISTAAQHECNHCAACVCRLPAVAWRLGRGR